MVAEGFGIPGLSQPGVDETVRAAIRTLETAGAAVSEISLPWHRDGLHVWNVIATDGATNQMIANTAPFDVTGHPATSVPAGLADGLPVGMMIVGRHLADGTCLRVARAFENAVGGFPAPPGY